MSVAAPKAIQNPDIKCAKVRKNEVILDLDVDLDVDLD